MTTALSRLDHRYHSRQVWVAVIIATVIILVAWLVATVLRQHRPQPATTRPAMLATPAAFSDAIGVVRQIHDRTLSVDVTTTDAQGQLHHRTYQVTADQTTMVERLQGSTLSPLRFDQVTVNDRVQVAADLNLANIDHFTATKIFQLITP